MKISKLKKNIQNFQQLNGESLYEAWDGHKGMLMNCPKHELNVQQEICSFYNGINVCTRQLLNSQGSLTKKDLTTNKALITEFAKHSREYHNLQKDVRIGKSNGDEAQEKLVSIIIKLDTMDRRISKAGQSIHAIQVRYDNCSGAYLTKDCDLDDNGNKKDQVCYSSGDQFEKTKE